MSLEVIGKLVAQHSASPVAVQRRNDKVALEQAAVRTMFNWIMLGMIILGAGVAMIVVNKNFDIGKWFSLLSSFLILGGTGVATAGVLNAIRRAPGISGPPEQKSLPTNPIPDELPSITERTTQLIPAEEAQAREAGDSIKPGAQAPG